MARVVLKQGSPKYTVRVSEGKCRWGQACALYTRDDGLLMGEDASTLRGSEQVYGLCLCIVLVKIATC
jgi:hypothetical protein